MGHGLELSVLLVLIVSVTAAASGTGATRRPGGQRRAAYRERGSGGIEGDLRSETSSRATSPSMSPRIPRTAVSKRGGGCSNESGENVRVPAGTALVAAQRILALATESFGYDEVCYGCHER